MVLFLRNLFFGILVIGFAAGSCARAQTEPERSNLRRPLEPLRAVTESGPASSIEDELHQMSEQAGVIFAGQVLAVRQQGAAGSGWVDIEFRVEEAIRGCVGQGTYTLREWAGLWAGGLARYRVGEQLLMLLHAPTEAGLSSPVGGQDGAIPITGSGQAPGAGDDFVVSGEQAVDLRWIQARLLRSASNASGNGFHARPMTAVEPVFVGKEQALLVTRKGVPPSVRGNQQQRQEVENDGMLVHTPTLLGGLVDVPASGGTAQGSTLRAVLAMLGAWEAQQANAVR